MKKHICLTITAGMLLSSAYNYTQEESPKKETPGVFRRAAVFAKKRPFLIATGAVGLGLTGYFGYQHLSAASYYGSEKSPNQIVNHISPKENPQQKTSESDIFKTDYESENSPKKGVNHINPQQKPSGSGMFTIAGAGIFTIAGAGIFFRKRLKNIIPKANLKLGHNYELKALQEKTARCMREKWIIFKDALKKAKKETPQEAKINAEIQSINAEIQSLKTAEKEFLEAEKKWHISSYLDYQKNCYNRLEKLHSKQFDTAMECERLILEMRSKSNNLHNVHSEKTYFWLGLNQKLDRTLPLLNNDNIMIRNEIHNHIKDITTFGKELKTWKDISIELNNIKYSSEKPSDLLGLVKEKLKRAELRHKIYLERQKKRIYYENEKNRIDNNFNTLINKIKDDIKQFEKKYNQDITKLWNKSKKEFEEILSRLQPGEKTFFPATIIEVDKHNWKI